MSKKRSRSADLRKVATEAMKAFKSAGCIDFKRPLGNSDIGGDVLEIIDWEGEIATEWGPEYSDEQVAYAEKLWDDVPTYLLGLLKKAGK